MFLQVIAYVKDEGTNLITLANALSSVVSCDVLGLNEPYSGTCFGHVMSKVCKYNTNLDTICSSMKHVSLKNAQSTLQKIITWTKNNGKGRQEWEKTCIEAGLPSRRLKTLVKTQFSSRIIMFEESLEYASAINICYQRLSLQRQARVSSGLTWARKMPTTRLPSCSTLDIRVCSPYQNLWVLKLQRLWSWNTIA